MVNVPLNENYVKISWIVVKLIVSCDGIGVQN